MPSLAEFYPNSEVFCQGCHEWSAAEDWPLIGEEDTQCPNCEQVNGPMDGPLYSRPLDNAR